MSPPFPGSSLEAKFARFARKGDSRALGQVFDQLAPELYALAAHLSRHPAEAEDLVSETFLAAIEHADRYDPKRPLRPWLVGILVRVRKRRQRSAARAIDADRLVPPRATDPIQASQGSELDESLTVALEHIPGTYREVLRLHLLEDCAPREIAKRLGRAGGTVRVQLHRGLDLLKRALPAGFQPASLSAVLPLGHLADMRERVVAAAAEATPAPAAPLLPARVGIGALVVVLGAVILKPMVSEPDELLRGDASLEQSTAQLDAKLEPVPPPGDRDSSDDDSTTGSELGRVDPGATRTAVGGSRKASPKKKGQGQNPRPDHPLPYFLEGLVESRQPADLTRTVVRIRDNGEILAEGSVTAEGRFRLAVNHTTEDRGSVQLLADHPEFALSIQSVALQGGEYVTDPQPHMLLNGMAWLTPPKTWLVGRVHLPGSGHVALFSERNGAPMAECLDECELVEGRYELRPPSYGEFVLVALVEGFQPSYQEVSVTRNLGARYAPPDFHLARGRRVDFHVQLPVGRNASRIKLEVKPTRFVRDLRWKGLVWRDTPIRASQRFALSAEGNLEAFVPELDLDVILHEVPALDEPTEPEPLRAADSFCSITPPISVMELRVVDRDGPLEGVRVKLDTSVGTSRTTDEHGRVKLLLQAGAQTWGRVFSEHGEHSFAFSAPAPGMTLSHKVVVSERTAVKR